VTTAGSFNVDFVNGTWAESTITSSLSPALGTTIQASVPLTAASKNQYILIDVTSALQAWLSGSQANDGIALVANGTFNAAFDSKESTTTSHSPELDVVFAGGGGGGGTITGVLTGAGSGLTGGGTSGTLNLSLTTACANKQVLQWNGSAWVCASAGTGTITGVTAGTDLTGGGTSGTVTLNLDTTKVPSLAAANVFTNNQSILGNSSNFGLTVAGATYEGILLSGPEALIGAALEIQTTGTNGMYWQIMNTGKNASQGINKLNFRNDSVGVDAMTLLPNGQVGIGTTSPNLSGGWLTVNTPASGGTNMNGIVANGANPTGEAAGGSGIVATGGKGAAQDGDGGFFTGGNSSSFGDGLQAIAGSGGIAANFKGNVTITGNLSAGSKNFKIDHPLDPANKYLVHASVESSEMMNIYTGNVITDAQGEARVQLPKWFEAINTDFRYQLTVIGQFAQAIVSSEVQNHEFAIRSSMPNVKVSWQITGVRQDAFAIANPMVVEEEKDSRLKGFYLHPEFYGAPAEKQIEWARHPSMMKMLEEHKQQ
jgi:trimeric autotransporter adhesin